ncbi:hypothetical protein ABT095_13485 [Kitasatospora sp. NPDC002227]
MAAPTLQARQGDTLGADAEFDLVIGELEQDVPQSTSEAGTCIRIYCVLQ